MSPSFLKMQACGNDFVVAHTDHDVFSGMASRLMDRKFGVGADGLMLVQPITDGDFEIKMLNPDGSSMGMCGNGIRCVARYVVLQNLWTAEKKEIVFKVQGRKLKCTLEDAGQAVRVDMGIASFDPPSLPFRGSEEFINSEIKVGDDLFRATLLSLGNPHCVIFVEDAEAINLQMLGPKIEHHEMFPERINVEFVQVLARDCLKVKVWERGAGATLACGTGACASLVAAVKNDLTSRLATVSLPGGELQVEWGQDERVFLTGPAEEVFSGQIRKSFLEKR